MDERPVKSLGAREELLAALDIRDNGGGSGLPASGAHLTVHVCVLESLYQAQSLVHAAAHRQVVDRDLAKNTLWIDGDEFLF